MRKDSSLKRSLEKSLQRRGASGCRPVKTSAEEALGGRRWITMDSALRATEGRRPKVACIRAGESISELLGARAPVSLLFWAGGAAAAETARNPKSLFADCCRFCNLFSVTTFDCRLGVGRGTLADPYPAWACDEVACILILHETARAGPRCAHSCAAGS